LVRVDDS